MNLSWTIRGSRRHCAELSQFDVVLRVRADHENGEPRSGGVNSSLFRTTRPEKVESAGKVSRHVVLSSYTMASRPERGGRRHVSTPEQSWDHLKWRGPNDASAHLPEMRQWAALLAELSQSVSPYERCFERPGCTTTMTASTRLTLSLRNRRPCSTTTYEAAGVMHFGTASATPG